jgi:hypothetical protein
MQIGVVVVLVGVVVVVVIMDEALAYRSRVCL